MDMEDIIGGGTVYDGSANVGGGGGGCTHIATRTGTLKELNSYRETVIIVARRRSVVVAKIHQILAVMVEVLLVIQVHGSYSGGGASQNAQRK